MLEQKRLLKLSSLFLAFAMHQVKIRDFAMVHGGEGGIRTHETLRPGGFQDRCTRPLCDLSTNYDIITLISSKFNLTSLLDIPGDNQADDLFGTVFTQNLGTFIQGSMSCCDIIDENNCFAQNQGFITR